jgi:hypothetical protein
MTRSVTRLAFVLFLCAAVVACVFRPPRESFSPLVQMDGPGDEGRLAVLVIASRGDPVHELYLARLWPTAIRRCAERGIDVFLVFGRDASLEGLDGIPAECIIVAPTPETYVPGILHKTLFALRHDVRLRGRRAVFRTNLSSALAPAALLRAAASGPVGYASGLVFPALRAHLRAYGAVAPEVLAGLGRFESDSYCSGCGFFLGAEDVRILLERQDRGEIEERLLDDVAIGLCLSGARAARALPGFSVVLGTGNRDEWPRLAAGFAAGFADGSGEGPASDGIVPEVGHARLQHLCIADAGAALNLLGY